MTFSGECVCVCEWVDGWICVCCRSLIARDTQRRRDDSYILNKQLDCFCGRYVCGGCLRSVLIPRQYTSEETRVQVTMTSQLLRSSHKVATSKKVPASFRTSKVTNDRPSAIGQKTIDKLAPNSPVSLRRQREPPIRIFSLGHRSKMPLTDFYNSVGYSRNRIAFAKVAFAASRFECARKTLEIPHYLHKTTAKNNRRVKISAYFFIVRRLEASPCKRRYRKRVLNSRNTVCFGYT